MSNKNYLTVHGHFYQPPRENPCLDFLERQESASPFHDWNERVCYECYSPNASSKIVDGNNKILDIVNNYEMISFNFGATLLSWLERYAPDTYANILKADAKSVLEHNGHGNAIAQVYNHIIMPLATKEDKYLQVVWGIRDFQRRFNRMPEGMWLAETACDDETLGVLADCGIKFTILSPYQAKSFRKIGDKNFIDVSAGNIDTTVPYIYNIKSKPGKFIVLFFYNAQISQAVAFEELLKSGERFVNRLKSGINHSEDYPRLTNIATDGESYGHHTKFGDMALAYALRVKAPEEGFTLTNYGEFLSLEEPHFEADIKPVSSWSCCHGVGRWKEDCGCSTGGKPGWNQKWRKPLREALDYLRDKFNEIITPVADEIFIDFSRAKQNYIDVILDKSEENEQSFIKNELKTDESDVTVKAFKILEMKRLSLLMYTSCGWFFNEISGIETVQILKYAKCLINLLKSFSNEDIETKFENILSLAKSNVTGTGKDIYEKEAESSVITFKQIAALNAIKQLYEPGTEKKIKLYAYEINNLYYKLLSRGAGNLIISKISIKSVLTTEEKDYAAVLLQYAGGDFHCVVKNGFENFATIAEQLSNVYLQSSQTEVIRFLDDNFGRDYFTLKDIFPEERKKVLSAIFRKKTEGFSSIYTDVFNEGKIVAGLLNDFNLQPSTEFKLAAQYVLSKRFNSLFEQKDCMEYESTVQNAVDIIKEADLYKVKIDKTPAEKFFSGIISSTLGNYTENFDYSTLKTLEKYLEISEILKLKPDISKAQNIYFEKIYSKFSKFLQNTIRQGNISKIKDTLSTVLKIGDMLNINTEIYQNAVEKASV